MRKKIAFAALGILLGGCSTYAGPFVTDIRPNGDGSLLVEKCMVKHTPGWFGVGAVSNARCSSRTVDLKSGTIGKPSS